MDGGLLDGWMGQWMDGQMDGWLMDGWIDINKEGMRSKQQATVLFAQWLIYIACYDVVI